MILQALTKYYEALVELGKLDRPGWNKVNVSYALELDTDGKLLHIHSLRQDRAQGKKIVSVPVEMTVPAPVKRSSGVRANFLCDNSSYLLGIDGKSKQERTIECFEAAKALHLTLLKEVDSPSANGVRKFFERWNPKQADEILKGNPFYEDIMRGANLVFIVNDIFAQTDSAIKMTWQSAYDGNDNNRLSAVSRCLITGEKVNIERIHPSIKGIPGAQSSGAALVSFNAPSFCSFGKEQNLNAPVGKYAAFAYTTALNYLIKDKEHRTQFGDTTVVFWAETGEPEYQDAFSALMNCFEDNMTNQDLNAVMQKLSRGIGLQWHNFPLNPKNQFYILGISPNASRLSVRFFQQDSFGGFVNNLYQHMQRIELIPNHKVESNTIPLWRLVKATVNENSRDKTASPKMTGETLRAILSGGRYPSTLFQQVQLRLKADRNPTWERMAIVKAYILRNSDDERKKEGMTVQLNEQTTYLPYLLGRLFAVLESIQERANPGINTTIKDKYFSSASATPAVVFPTLLNLKDKHLKKLDKGIGIFYDKQVSELMTEITEDYPKHLSLQDQGVFQIGYYHQKQKRFERKNQEDL